MSQPRAPQEFEVPEVINFLDKHLRPQTDWSIAAEYPFVFHTANRNNLRIITNNDHRVLAHAATKYLIAKSTAGLFKVAAIGSVLTDPDFRGQGLSQEILKSALEAAEQEGADFAILWTDLYDLYRKVGFELAGTEISVVIDSPMAVPLSNIKILKTNKVDASAILKLYGQHTCTTIRSSEEIRKSLQIPNSNVYTAWSPDNRLLAYAVEGKGVDLRGYIHEWGGAVPELVQLFAHIRSDYGQTLTVLTPASAENLRRNLAAYASTEHHGFLGMIRPVCEQNFFAKILRHARRSGVNDFILEKRDDKYIIGTQEDQISLNTVNELTRLIFGPLDKTLLKPEFQKILPIPMWVWGWDSV